MAVLASKDTLTPEEWLAIKIVGKHADNFREKCAIGKAQPVDMLVRIRGSVDVMPDKDVTKKTVTGPSAVDLLAHFLKNMQPDEIDRVLACVDTTVEIEKQFKESAEDVVRQFQTVVTTTTSAFGATKGIFEIGRVELNQITSAVNETLLHATRLIDFGEQ